MEFGDSSVGIATGWMAVVRVLAETGFFSAPQCLVPTQPTV
jgi:hypothetical protein